MQAAGIGCAGAVRGALAGSRGRIAARMRHPPVRRVVLTAAWSGLAFLLWLGATAALAGSPLARSPLIDATKATDAARWILVDTVAATLTVLDGAEPRLVLRDIAIGRSGTSTDKRRGDDTTPTGRFRISAIRRDSRFHRFIVLDYPDLPRALRARQQGLIDQQQWHAIAAAHARLQLPPQDTPLGGHIGIHGLGRGDPELHRLLNWTRGCVALTDAQVDRLLDWVGVGMPLEIRGPPRP